LLIWRWPLLRARNELESVVSREFAFLLNNWLFLAAALFVGIATIYPTLTELPSFRWFHNTVLHPVISVIDRDARPITSRITLGPAFYNHYMAPVGLALLGLMGIGPLVAWRKTTGKSLVQQFTGPAIAGAVGTIAAAVLIPLVRSGPEGTEFVSVPGLVCFGLCAFTFWTIVQEFHRGVKVRRKHRPQSVLDALIGLVVRARRRYGGYIVHLGVVLMFFGFAGNSY